MNIAMKPFITSIKIFLVFTILTGILYPLLITGIGQLAFPKQVNGSLIMKDGHLIGSAMIGQKFTDSSYFHPRPSASDYNAVPGLASNAGPTDIRMKERVLERRQQFLAENGLDSTAEVPAEMLTASGSGLDPHISFRAAMLQVNRISKARGFTRTQYEELKQLVIDHTEKPQWGILGEQRVNVLLLNLDLDKLQ